MESMKTPSPEERKQLLEKARREAEEAFAKLSPEEREKVLARTQQMMTDDRAANQALIDAARAAAMMPGAAPDAPKSPKFCPNCGAPAGDGNFCTFCGGRLRG